MNNEDIADAVAMLFIESSDLEEFAHPGLLRPDIAMQIRKRNQETVKQKHQALTLCEEIFRKLDRKDLEVLLEIQTGFNKSMFRDNSDEYSSQR